MVLDAALPQQPTLLADSCAISPFFREAMVIVPANRPVLRVRRSVIGEGAMIP